MWKRSTDRRTWKQRTVRIVLENLRRFDIECAYGRTYDIKQIRKDLLNAINIQARNVEVVRMGRQWARLMFEDHPLAPFNVVGLSAQVHDLGLILNPVEEAPIEELVEETISTAAITVPIKTVPYTGILVDITPVRARSAA